jgi:alginate O-acetyltransferase complex protein AlgI
VELSAPESRMLFSEPSFLFFFLPLTFLVYFLLPQPGTRSWPRNLWLVVASLAFFLWREKIGLLLVPILLNYGLGLWVGRTRTKTSGKIAIATAVSLNLAILVWFKYANFMVDNANAALGLMGSPTFHLKQISLPLGISFLTFHGISYLVDIHRGDAPADVGFLETALYLSFFPKLIAGPIVRYQDFVVQMKSRAVTREDLAFGVQRIVMGLAKKTILAGTLALTVDQVFQIPSNQLTTGIAWLGALCYTLQLYLDFSGYSDIAIGLARMLGFRIQENFNYPYISKSITEFWRRWHISLSTWFRDYLFFPLGANKYGPTRGYINLLIVFILCGFWHGANWTFVLWGLWQGIFLVLERVSLGRRLSKLWAPFQHGYALLVIVTGWVVFRSPSVGASFHYLKTMAGFPDGAAADYQIAMFLDTRVLLAVVIGTFVSTPLMPKIKVWIATLPSRKPEGGEALRHWLAVGGLVALCALFLVSAMFIAAGTYNPFLYFKF